MAFCHRRWRYTKKYCRLCRYILLLWAFRVLFYSIWFDGFFFFLSNAHGRDVIRRKYAVRRLSQRAEITKPLVEFRSQNIFYCKNGRRRVVFKFEIFITIDRRMNVHR